MGGGGLKLFSIYLDRLTTFFCYVCHDCGDCCFSLIIILIIF